MNSIIATIPFTPRLRPVLQHILAGDAEKQVALKLGLSPHTVHEYVKCLYRTLGVKSRGELFVKCFANGGAVWSFGRNRSMYPAGVCLRL